MPLPTETPPPPATEFDPLVIWIQHKAKIKLLIAVLLLGLVAYGVFELTERRSREAAERAFAAAKSPEDLRKVIADHPRSIVAANAQLILAEQLRAEGNADESVAIMRTFLEKHGDHPLISGAWISLASSLEAQGKTDEALSTFQKVATLYPTSFAAPVALLAQGRIGKAMGQTDQARRAYEQVVAQFGQSNFAREAMMDLQKLKPDAATEASAPSSKPSETAPPATPEVPAVPAPTPPADPAPPVEAPAPK